MRKIIRQAAAVLLSAALLLTGTASAAAQIDPVEERLAAMPLQEKVGQLFVVRVEALDPSGQSDSTRLTWAERQGLKKYPVGGIVVFRQNVKSPEQLKKLLADFQAASGTGLLTAVDEEGGSVARLANASGFDLPQYQSAQAVGTTGDPANARAMGQIIGGYLKTYGLNLDFAPVADVNTNPANTVIGNRAFRRTRQWRHRWWPPLYKGFTMRAYSAHSSISRATEIPQRTATTARPAAPRLGQRCGRRS